MTKQEEIREGLIGMVDELGKIYLSGVKAKPQVGADAILKYFHSQGVVIKVDRELPQCPYERWQDHPPPWDDEDVLSVIKQLCHQDGQRDMLKAGYVAVEPLVTSNDKENTRTKEQDLNNTR